MLKLGLNSGAFLPYEGLVNNGDLENEVTFEWKNVNQVRNNENLSFSAITANGSDASPVIIIDARYS